HGHHRMPVGKIELDPTGDPRPAKRDQSILHNLVPIENFSPRYLVEDRVHTTAEFRQDDDLEELIFEIDGAVGFRLATIRKIVEHSIWIYVVAVAHLKRRIGIFLA